MLFRQIRIGRHGKPFMINKFRTMVVNHHGSTISIKGENRITSLGAKLRKYKLDELPELWNILIGEMSFVGPRPDVPGFADLLEGDDRRILELRPGITSPASIKYANEEELFALQSEPAKFNQEVVFPDKVRINLEYIDNWSFFKDIKYIFITIFGRK